MRCFFLITLLLNICLISIAISAEKPTNGEDKLNAYSEKFKEKYSHDSRVKLFDSDTGSSNPSSGSSIDIDLPLAETPPVDIVRNVLRPKKDGSFYKNEEITVLIKITSLKKDGLSQIEYWEIPGDDLNITQCSYQIRTSNIQEMRDYEKRNDSFLQKNDIINNTGIALSLKNNQTANQARQELSNYIYKQLSNDTMALTDKTIANKTNETLREWLKDNLTRDFNRIINNDSTELAEHFAKCNINIDRKRVCSLNPASLDYHKLYDYRLQKRLILEHIFPKMIKNLTFLKNHERQIIDNEDNSIRIIEGNIRQGETIIFKYMLRPTELGLKEIRYIIRADGCFQEGVATFSVSERGEKFSINSQCDSKDITKYMKENFTYSIEYLGGNEECKSFPIIITPPEGCEITGVSWEDNLKPKINKDLNSTSGNWTAKEIPFSKGITENLIITAVYYETGLRVSPPKIKIGEFEKLFEADLSVYSSYDNPFIIHYQFLTILLTIAAILISLIVAVFSSFELYIANKEMKLIREQLENENIERIKACKLEEKEIETFEKLSRIINKILGD